MRLKQIDQLNEGPFDFMRGAGAALGQKVANSSPVKAAVNAGRDVIQAGQQASLVADLEKIIAKLASNLMFLEKTKPAQPAVQAPAAKQAAAAPGQPAPAGPNGAPMVQGKYGPEYQFSSFMQAIHGEQLDEGIWDFVKGAGGAIGKKVGNKINKFAADSTSVFKDIYAAGQNASQKADTEKQAAAQSAAVQKAEMESKQLVSQALKILKQLGDNAGPAMIDAARKAGGPMARKIVRILGSNASKMGMNLMPTLTNKAA